MTDESAFGFSFDEVFSELMVINKPDRLDAFLDEFADEMSDEDYWQTVALLWTTMEYPSQQESWLGVWTDVYRQPSRAHVMTEQEREQLAELPERVTIYRGFSGDEWRGLSWTLDRSRAEMFARRFAVLFGPGSIAVTTIARDEIVALLNGRSESEIVVMSDELEVEVFGMEPLPGGN
jgi:hypothetical protein